MDNQDKTPFELCPYFRNFKIKYLGPTNTRGSRIRIICSATKKSKIIRYTGEYTNSWEDAYIYLISKGFNIIFRIGDDKHDYLITDSYDRELT